MFESLADIVSVNDHHEMALLWLLNWFWNEALLRLGNTQKRLSQVKSKNEISIELSTMDYMFYLAYYIKSHNSDIFKSPTAGDFVIFNNGFNNYNSQWRYG